MHVVLSYLNIYNHLIKDVKYYSNVYLQITNIFPKYLFKYVII